MGRTLNYRRIPRRQGYQYRPSVSSFHIPPAEALWIRIRLARLKREAERRRSRP